MTLLKRCGFIFITVICMGLTACDLMNLNAEPTDEEMLMPEAKYYSTAFTPIPAEVMDAVSNGPVAPEKILPFEDIDKLAKPGYLELENGYAVLDDGTAFVAVRTDFPYTDGDMIKWWFWWHALKDIRYKIWCPGAHYAISAENMDQLTDKNLSDMERWLNNPHYPVEDIGAGAMPLSIRFLPPEEMGFDTTAFEAEGVAAVVCGVVGFKIGNLTIDHTYMCHLFRKTENGLELRSRFWLGKALNCQLLRKMVITEDLTTDMLLHCTQEYNHLAGFLPTIYEEFSGNDG